MSTLLSSGLMYGCVAPALIRNVAQGFLKCETAELDDVCLFLGASRSESLPVWNGLVADGWIVQEGEKWMPSKNIRQLANARIGKPLPRAKAKALLAQAIKNAEALNQLAPDTREIYYITKIAVFGSYLSDKQELGDLDIAWSVADRVGTDRWAVGEMMYGRDSFSVTRGRFRPKSPYVGIIFFSNLLELGCPYEVVYSFDPPKEAGRAL